MKRMLLLAAVVVLTSVGTGCNRAWPGCFFCRDNDFGDYAATEACQPCDPCDPCDPYGVAYGSTGVEFVQPSAGVVTESQLLPGPATTTPAPAPAPARQ